MVVLLRKFFEIVWGLMVLMGIIGIFLFSCYLVIVGIVWIMTHLFEIMMFGILCATIVFIVAIVKHIWEVLTDEER